MTELLKRDLGAVNAPTKTTTTKTTTTTPYVPPTYKTTYVPP